MAHRHPARRRARAGRRGRGRTGLTSTGGAPGPVRTCVGCRERAPAGQLLRVVAREGALVPDPRKVLTGRGASVHRRSACLELAVRRRAFPRALRVSGPLDAGAVADWVAGHGEAPDEARR